MLRWMGGGLLLAVNIYIAIAILWGSHGLGTYRQQKKAVNELQTELQRVRQANVDLSRKIRLLKSDREYMEQVIRTKLHYVHPDEIMYLPISEAEGRTAR